MQRTAVLDSPERGPNHGGTFPTEEERVVRGYVLIETDVGSAKAVGAAAAALTYPGATVLAVDTVTGPYDVIVQLEASDLDALGTAITDAIQTVTGV